MSSSQRSSNNSDNNTNTNTANQNPYADYDIDDPLNSQQQQQMFGVNNRNEIDENEFDNSPEDIDEDLPNEIVAELDAREQLQANNNNNNNADEDESVFSDVVQDAFKKYQNEFSKYWIHDDTTWDDSFSDDELYDEEQEELYAQMEECWNFMTEEYNNVSAPNLSSTDQNQSSSILNPDAIEFKPSWLKPSPTPPTNNEQSISSSSSQTEEQAKKI